MRLFFNPHNLSLFKSIPSLKSRSHFTFKALNLSPSIYSPSNIQHRSIMTFKTSNAIEKPDLDDRDYKIINLNNGLKALLISDPKTDKSAAALDVNVGAFSDYEHLPGLAHFCEHLLFMGTKKYPSENEYSSYLSNHGGHSNAYTAAEDTNYYFEINYQYLEGALDRFSQFFISPLFDPSCKDREIRAVDSENKKNLQNDVWRLYQLDKSLSNPEHPYHKFSTGNLQTLGEIPESQGVDVRDELLRFYKDSYSANLMKLSIIGREPLDVLEKWTVEKFSEVPNYNRPKPTFDHTVFTSNELQKFIKAKPVMAKDKLNITFVVPDQEEHWKSQTSHYYSHLLGHEGKGSLYAFLKNKGYANGLSSGGYTVTKGNATFGIDIDLTEKGLANYEEALVATFQYIKLLQSSPPERYIFEELREVSEMNFKFKQKTAASSTVSNLAKVLQKTYLPDEYILSRNVLREYSPDLIAKFGESFQIENSRITLVSQSVETDKNEKWYGTEYSVSNYSQELLTKLKILPLNDKLHLPPVNEFIPTNFKVEKLDNAIPTKSPELLKVNDKFRFWYKKDDQFWVPKGSLQVIITSPIVVSSPFNNVLTSLFTSLILDSLLETSYEAELAGLHFNTHSNRQGISIEVNGYNEKAHVLLKTVLKELTHLVPKEDRFVVIKEKEIRLLKNHHFKAPYNQITGVFGNLVKEDSWTTEDKLASIESVTYQDLLNFIPLILKQIFVETLVHGNFTKAEAHEIINIVEESLEFQPLTPSQKIKLRSYQLPEDKTFRYDYLLPDENNTNSCIQYFAQVGELTNYELRSKTSLLGQLIKEPAFDVLRTKEQLGYIVFSGSVTTNTTFGFRIIIQSEKSAAFLESRIQSFLENYYETLKNLSVEEFEKNKEALINRKLETLKNLHQENSRFLIAILEGDYDFLEHEELAKLIGKITKDELLEFYERFILNSNGKLIVNLHAKDIKDDDKVDNLPKGEVIANIGDFKSSLSLTPAIRPILDLIPSNFTPKL